MRIDKNSPKGISSVGNEPLLDDDGGTEKMHLWSYIGDMETSTTGAGVAGVLVPDDTSPASQLFLEMNPSSIWYLKSGNSTK